jgi:hypothetical protein
MLSPSIGWKIDLGKPNGLIMPISVGVTWITGPSTFSNIDLDITPYAKVGIGRAF